MNRKSSSINQLLRRVTQNCDQWIGPVGLILGVICAVTIGLPTGIDIYQNWQNLDPKDRSQAGITLIQTIATIVGGIAIFWNIVLSRRQLAASQEHNITERFSIAVEQLGHEQTAVRIGGIYALERIAQDSPRDYWSIMEVLAAFVRDQRSLEADEKIAQTPITYDKDIESAIMVIGRRNTNLDPEGLSLYFSYSDLRGISFYKDDHSNARFVCSDLREANFYRSNLRNARFWKAILTNAKFNKANLNGASLEEADLKGVDFSNCLLEGANLKGANLKGTCGLTIEQIKSAHNWQAAIYDDELMVQLSIKVGTPGNNPDDQSLATQNQESL
ncbi:pentapeptide repeat protein [Leptolyngbya sp. Heron Island J]|uniref:pentapeptide repeat-containing protein n=1 Tax=Leptolyngbya sp. Heron Island J TaxID=1385935 RepID=UPI0003B93B8C|nr:pentapeptide repeat-containing protein [Leptolyngbya sp. Heron Island J]ESA37883.1 pentapeptide repeat protein [Leptolyngbya sp. Heron Island J]